MINLVGQYITNTSSENLPIYAAGKIETTNYLNPGQRYPIQIDAVGMHSDGKYFAVAYPSGKDNKPVYIYIGQDLGGGDVDLKVKGSSRSEYIQKIKEEIISKKPIGTFTYIKIAVGLFLVGYLVNAFKKR